MSIKQSSLKTARKSKKLAALVTAFFFVSTAILYATLGTFFSSCGPGAPRNVNIAIKAYTFSNCIPDLDGPNVDFEQSYDHGWDFELVVLMGDDVYSAYSFVTSSTSGGASLDGFLMKSIAVPSEAQFRFEMTIISPCNCGASSQRARYFFESNNFNIGAQPGNIGQLKPPVFIGC